MKRGTKMKSILFITIWKGLLLILALLFSGTFVYNSYQNPEEVTILVASGIGTLIYVFIYELLKIVGE